ncbi:hypothetical protein MHU86_17470 [Fragilaria crotonensis]|nr:hypothetical protein MHU86_17470 [Fragilaria crotonensis]
MNSDGPMSPSHHLHFQNQNRAIGYLSMKRLATFLLLTSPCLSQSFGIHRGPRRPVRRMAIAATLVPEENPTADPNKFSKSGASYAAVLQGLHELYPPTDLAKRNAASRTDGYWPFIQKGQDPPKQLTYGEFDFYFFAELLDRAQDLYYQGNNKDDDPPSWNGKTFCDIGSGTGRLVLAAAALHPGWRLCRGVELLNSIHVVAEETLARCNPTSSGIGSSFEENQEVASSFVGEDDILKQFEGKFVLEEEGRHDQEPCDDAEGKDDPALSSDVAVHYLPLSSESDMKIKLAPIHFTCGSFDDPNVYFGDSDCVFVFSSCMSKSIISSLSKAIGYQCKPGTIVISTEFPLELEGTVDPSNDPDELRYSHCNYDGDFDDPDDREEWYRFCAEEGIEPKPFKFELVETIDGYCWLTGGVSTAYIHRVVSSAWEEGRGPSDAKEISNEEEAAMAWIYGLKQHTKDFYRDVRNNMIFHGFSEKWYTDLEG